MRVFVRKRREKGIRYELEMNFNERIKSKFEQIPKYSI